MDEYVIVGGVSIHAPVMGANKSSITNNGNLEFQSTHP